MEKSRYEAGLEKLNEVDGKTGDRVVQSLKDIAPDLGRFIIEFAFGDIYTRPELDLRQRELITLSSLASIGGTENQLRVHINGALNVGVTTKEISEAFIQCVPYVGFPRALNAVAVAKEVFKERNLI
ncbi:carboxymuconolactone decarboxylase family protein [Sporolactobacillus shoreicorticis]|uniref:Carboxymuconolactone decarboxylase family protein n=1 Tax=Sporolactobacillus shoreicorticis TaxID=1923877 RepID=A0ABW5S2P7_9BACL|nr:carboxymuconolactone decarboxylase family protein [Sporolactobacillus shoreicorticis]MCO7126490.1 carboxymuconolactone decarboxylase family protein [Sporolactobacillus shoreicorticis]